jgi:predicted transcriptional regulator
MHTANKTRVTVTVPSKTLAQIDRAAEQQSRSRSAHISHILKIAVTGQTRLAALEQLAQAVIDEGAAPEARLDPTQQQESNMPSADFDSNRQQAVKPTPLDPRLTATGRDIQRELPSLGTSAKGALGGSTAPTLAHSK